MRVDKLIEKCAIKSTIDQTLTKRSMPNSVLSSFHLSPNTSIAQAQPVQQEMVTLESPGMAVMTDLTQVRAATVPPTVDLAKAELMMIHQGVRLLFVVNQMPGVDGIVTAVDLQGEKPLRLVSQRQVKFEELCIADVMTPLSDMEAIDFAALRRANVAQVIAALANTGRAHLLVIESATATAPMRIRGVISKTQIERQIGAQLPATGMATTFAEMTAVLS